MLWLKRQEQTIKWAVINVTRCLEYLFNIWPFTTTKIGRKNIKFTKISSILCQILNEHFEKWPKFFNVMPKWQNLPNMVTLAVIPVRIPLKPTYYYLKDVLEKD